MEMCKLILCHVKSYTERNNSTELHKYEPSAETVRK